MVDNDLQEDVRRILQQTCRNVNPEPGVARGATCARESFAFRRGVASAGVFGGNQVCGVPARSVRSPRQ